ncbi:YwqG family protein [Chitinophaga sp. 212800008-4]|uniref:YwqG family protein n=1 Tax=unclassified Chitinophaga TaxID=2619133 RepID=UPI0030D39246
MELNEQGLKALIKESSLELMESYLAETTKSVTRLSYSEKENYHTAGNNRIAGFPDLPAGFQWPLTKEGGRMTFIAQLDLATLNSADPLQLLPANGMLYFFMGIDEPAYNIEHKVIWVPSKDDLVLTRPEGSTILDDTYEPFTGWKFNAVKSLMPPNYNYLEEELTDEAFEAYEDMTKQLNTSAGLMWGYPAGQHSDSEIEAAINIILKKYYDYKPANARQALLKHFSGDEAALDHELNNMLMLLELDSADETGFLWWDAGCIHFFIRKEDLLNRNFDNTYLSLYSS